MNAWVASIDANLGRFWVKNQKSFGMSQGLGYRADAQRSSSLELAYVQVIYE